MFKVIGLVRKVGEFNGLKYDNTLIHCTREGNQSFNEVGTMVEILKVKTDLASIIDIGDNINVYYDKFGKVQKIETL